MSYVASNGIVYDEATTEEARAEAKAFLEEYFVQQNDMPGCAAEFSQGIWIPDNARYTTGHYDGKIVQVFATQVHSERFPGYHVLLLGMVNIDEGSTAEAYVELNKATIRNTPWPGCCGNTVVHVAVPPQKHAYWSILEGMVGPENIQFLDYATPAWLQLEREKEFKTAIITVTQDVIDAAYEI